MNLGARDQITILIVDDEKSIVDFIKMGLEGEGYLVYEAYDGNEAIELARKINPNIVILDIMLPGMDGYEVCSIIKKSIKTSVIMLTALDEVDDKVKGLDIGADDYMAKPFSFKELLARINARIRNSFPELSDITNIGNFKVDDKAHEITYREKVLDLPPTQYNLLSFLLMNNGIALSKSLILEKVWGYDFNGEDNIVEVYIRYLRDKIGDKDHNIIKTVRGVGYKMVAQ
ncbi:MULTISPECIES: response regulator transcription factor [Clostridium]|jgi:Response regulators consisting of a CheY-like receiver domain and a winged-helix DNA-binding domain|uniref:Stage 0 sporulation protein A homolog n=3 Tax=Clostridium TaxID=1485 RepID=A0AAE2V274_CLOBE|nr:MULTISPECIES: response regulator transcription factor [Clostridium]ABR36605.1 two component transcriptional regulator, winged helix family [Clostridium beijerinckii NCIMB 8052]AIU03724.1 two component transcriptional regulator [Clostridium beijerinckii ATCC 35702]ALB44354.1 DNA-binding response regulator [Clostridium beijerinckii NRRL B-598]MBC2456977.1 response regulator transcription factor [Clostridium beijerinckii]MBC2473459.1 response regulator transcription factor [Clostridium beijeri